MDIYIAATGALPAVGAMAYFDYLDRKRPEPPSLLRRVAIVAALSAIPCVIVELALKQIAPPMSPIATSFFEAFIVAALVEEIAKVATLRLTIWRRPEFDERMDGIVYGTRAGLGFALIENVLYLSGTKTFKEFLVMYFIRGLCSVPMHAIAGGLSGYFGAIKRFDGRGPGFLGGLVFAILLHGSFDAGLFLALVFSKTQPLLALALAAFALLLVVPSGLWLRRLAARAIAGDDAAARMASGV